MIVNELKPLLGDNWKSKFVHRDLWDPDGYGVASFDLGGDREKVLVINFATDDIMEYFYDDLPDDEWICIDRYFSDLLKTKLDKSYSTYVNKLYFVKGYANQIKKIGKNITGSRQYPAIKIFRKSAFVHRVIAFIFVPNPHPEKYDLVNHKDKSKINFEKENLEWCDAKWNAQKENQKKYLSSARYIRLDDGRVFSGEDLKLEYSKSAKTEIARSIRENKKYKGFSWRIVNLTVEDYLSRHPLQDDWYQHPTMPNVRANGCGVLEIGGKLSVGSKQPFSGYYIAKVNGKCCVSHRIILECFLGRELNDDEVVDHIIPVTSEDVNNSKENLRACSRTENMNNPLTAKKSWRELKIYNLFGNLLDTVESGPALMKKYNIDSKNVGKRILIHLGKYIINDPSRTGYIYYMWEIRDGKQVCINANSSFTSLYESSHSSGSWQWAKNRYLNTGMPAPDGFYYQQGDPQHMIYDPSNTSLEKKRPEIFWKDRNNNNKEGNND